MANSYPSIPASAGLSAWVCLWGRRGTGGLGGSRKETCKGTALGVPRARVGVEVEG